MYAAVLDFIKAFDRVHHTLLMEKFSKIETIDEYLLRWTHNFLLNRSQCVILNRKKSLKTCPSLPVYLRALSLSLYYIFLVFINDLPEEVDCQVALVADETLMMYQTIKRSHDTLKFQENLTALSKWADRWERKAKSCISTVKANSHTTHFISMS